MKPSTISYTDGAKAGLANATLQKSLKKIQNGFGKKAMRHWQTMTDSDLRPRAKARRMQTLEHLDIVLAELAEKIREHGGHVYFAATAEDAVRYTLQVAERNKVNKVVKGKSMTSAEIGIDPALQNAGIEVVETDLGEYIIQLAEDAPSHIIAPCIHMDRFQIGKLFTDKLGHEYSDDPPTLTRMARKSLREKLLSADMGITGCNIACAETGQISLVSNEGNIRMSTTMPRVHVALMGMERIAATFDEHRELLQLLITGATVQKLSTYVSFVGGPRHEGDPDGPEEFHLIVIDNGRSKILADPEFREVLACIRCGACLNICPVYGRIGGHAYNSHYCGPIGAVVTPLLNGINDHADLCKGETLCGACKDVCPVENDLPRMLSALRHKLAYGDKYWQVKPYNRIEAAGFKGWRKAISSRKAYNMLLKVGRFLQKGRIAENGMISSMPGPAGKWTRDRDLKPLATETFTERWRKHHSSRKMEEKS
ncbi:LutB/LldF family L-lactate oxidation iron-sulfur protein [Desulfopila aestuarii]|uniref:L-lactate dehydrogenase complex protein LldF n=1 Tax=Desulfopila aestuarii DSM 18488 TaxID=1121416 RepID=A0A1M7Y356_9BACT|nr:LutB/LldF family L-lactate oxidation iron-sulfur protein [Desulfopila aestuarii]SHO46586.1 L-lactate dehydrogenase complex protein LldF [Desulfopila aestuarii DSM 18488]